MEGTTLTEQVKALIYLARVGQTSWEADEDVLTFNGKPCGGTIDRHAQTDRWWPELRGMLFDLLAPTLRAAEARVERLKTMSTLEMMCENENVRQHVTEWEERCLKAEAREKELALGVQRQGEAIRYMGGIYERGTGKKLEPDDVIADKVLEYVKGLEEDNEHRARRLELQQREIDRWLPCPDHRDKVSGECYVCKCESLTTRLEKTEKEIAP